jgi:hypothetical protein
MADRYWVGGNGTWDATTTTNWSATSGGAGGASAPTSADNVFFNSASNATSYAVTVGTNAAALDVSIVGPASGTATITSAATSIISVYGSWTNAATGVAFSATANAVINFFATTTGKTITTNNVSLSQNTISLASSTGGWTLGSALTLSQSFNASAGTFSTGNFNMSINVLGVSSTTVRSISLGSSTITLGGSAGPMNATTTTNLTFNAGTSTIVLTNASATFIGGGLTYNIVQFTSTAASLHTISGVNTFASLSFTSRASDGIGIIDFSDNQTVTGTLTLGTTNTAVRRYFVRSSTIGTQRTLTTATLATLSDVDFRDIVAAGAFGTWSGTRIGDCKNNSNITFTAAKTVYLSSTAGANTNWTGICWANTTGGTPDVVNIPLAQDTAIIDDSGATTGNGLRTGFTLTYNSNFAIGTLTSTRTAAYIFSQSNQTPTVYGNLTLSSGITFSVATSPTWTFAGQGTTQTITTAGKIIYATNVTVNSPSGTVRLLDAFTQAIPTTAIAATFTLTSGTLDLNGFTLTTLAFNSSASNARTLAYGSTGKIVTTGGAGTSQTVFTTATTTNLTVTGSANNECFLTPSYSNTTTIRTISPGASLSEANSMNFYLTGGGVDTVLITNGHVFKDLNTSGHGANGVLSLSATNTSYGNLLLGTGTTVISSTPTSAITFASTSGTKTITTNDVSLDKSLTFSAAAGTWQLANNLTSNFSNTTVTLSGGILNLNNRVLTTGLFNSSGTGVRTLTSGTGTITLTGNNATIWNTGTATNLTYTTTPNVTSTYSGSTGTRGFSTAGSTDIINLTISAGSDTITPISTFNVNNYDFTGFSGTLTNIATNIYGNLTVSPDMSWSSGGNAFTFSATSGTKTIEPNGIAISNPIVFNGVGGTWQLQSALGTSSSYPITLSAGTLNTNSQDISCTTFASNNSTTRTLSLSNTAFGLSGSGTVWNCENSTNLTINYGINSLINLISSGPSTFAGGSISYPRLQGNFTDLTITGNNTFETLVRSASSNTTIRFPAGGTTTINTPQLTGVSSTGLLTLRSGTSGTQATISKPSTNDTVTLDYLTLQDIVATSNTGQTIWYAGANSTSNGNITGWTFTRGDFLQMMF